MGRGCNANSNDDLRTISWAEVREHTAPTDRWLVVDRAVYDISRWQRQHPGGARILGHFAGQDATDAFYAMHPDRKYASKFMKSLVIGKVEDSNEVTKSDLMLCDLRTLRQTLEEERMFKADPAFFILHLLHVIVLEVLGYLVLTTLGGGPAAFLLSALILTIGQAQAGWTQHDYGHLSVFSNTRLNHIFHHITIGILKAAGSHWWNFRHFQHHVKPNVHKKDPDITLPKAFLLGDSIPVKWGKQKRGSAPYQYQQNYFWLLGPMSLLPVYFHLENIYFVLKRRDWIDLCMTVIYFVRFDYLFAGYFGSRWMSFALYMSIRFMESFWFTFVTQMSHLPMEIDSERNRNWLEQQTVATCNVQQSWFNDWFTGHLNFQIEHHLFPTMPRHNYHKVAPRVRELCEKHNCPYTIKTLSTAFTDILRSLKRSGRLWYEAYHGL